MALFRLKPNHRFPSVFGLKADSFGVYVCYEGHSGTDLRTPFPSEFDPKRSFDIDQMKDRNPDKVDAFKAIKNYSFAAIRTLQSNVISVTSVDFSGQRASS